MKKVELSQIVRRKLNTLRGDLSSKYNEEYSNRTVATIIKQLKQLEVFSESGVRINDIYDIETDYYYLFVSHNYFIYRIEYSKVIIVNMFNEKEDYVLQLFGVSGRSQESIDYWGD